MQTRAVALHDIEELPDREIGRRFDVGRTAICMRRRRWLDSLSPAARDRYLDRFPPRRGRPLKHRRKGK